MDKEISNEFMKILKKQKINFHMQNKVEKIKKTKLGAVVYTKDQNENDNKNNNEKEGNNRCYICYSFLKQVR